MLGTGNQKYYHVPKINSREILFVSGCKQTGPFYFSEVKKTKTCLQGDTENILKYFIGTIFVHILMHFASLNLQRSARDIVFVYDK